MGSGATGLKQPSSPWTVRRGVWFVWRSCLEWGFTAFQGGCSGRPLTYANVLSNSALFSFIYHLSAEIISEISILLTTTILVRDLATSLATSSPPRQNQIPSHSRNLKPQKIRPTGARILTLFGYNNSLSTLKARDEVYTGRRTRRNHQMLSSHQRIELRFVRVLSEVPSQARRQVKYNKQSKGILDQEELSGEVRRYQSTFHLGLSTWGFVCFLKIYLTWRLLRVSLAVIIRSYGSVDLLKEHNVIPSSSA